MLTKAASADVMIVLAWRLSDAFWCVLASSGCAHYLKRADLFLRIIVRRLSAAIRIMPSRIFNIRHTTCRVHLQYLCGS